MKQSVIYFMLLFQTNALCADFFSPAQPLLSASIVENQKLGKIAFGSCFDQRNQDTIFRIIGEANPDIVLLLGDNIYPNSEAYDPYLRSLREAYWQLANSHEFGKLREKIPIMSIWDDHDYGLDDAGGDWPLKKNSERLFEYIWIPKNDERRSRDGIYFSRTVGPRDARVQLIFLDTRFFRSPLLRANSNSTEKYRQDYSMQKTMLGRAQWSWLQKVLQESAKIRLIVSSIQVIADGHGWEAWRTLPNERERLFKLLDKSEAKNIFILSGDRHLGAIYHREDATINPLWEITSSSLNKPLTGLVPVREDEPGPFRLGDNYYGANFGIIHFDWLSLEVNLSIHNSEGKAVRQTIVKLR